MRVISKRTLIEFWSRHADSRVALESWYQVVKSREWTSITDTRKTYSTADQVRVASGRIVTIFNVGGNNERVISAIHYNTRTVFILRVLTHAEYNKEAWKRNL